MAEKKPESSGGTEIFSIPKDPDKAVELVQKLTQKMGRPPFWRLNRWSRAPSGVRSYPEVAVLVHEDSMVRQNFMMLKYKDGTQTSISTSKMYKGHAILPCDITEKWVVCKAGERNLQGRTCE